jgi:hypothetical protein
MKRARQRRQVHIKPRNPLVVAAVLRKAGAHQRIDKRASRARQRQRSHKELDES